MSATIEDYDGLCGIIATFASSDLRLRCSYVLGHDGSCSFEKHRRHFSITGGCFRFDFDDWLNSQEDKDGVKEGFINSVVSSIMKK